VLASATWRTKKSWLEVDKLSKLGIGRHDLRREERSASAYPMCLRLRRALHGASPSHEAAGNRAIGPTPATGRRQFPMREDSASLGWQAHGAGRARSSLPLPAPDTRIRRWKPTGPRRRTRTWAMHRGGLDLGVSPELESLRGSRAVIQTEARQRRFRRPPHSPVVVRAP